MYPTNQANAPDLADYPKHEAIESVFRKSGTKGMFVEKPAPSEYPDEWYWMGKQVEN